MNCANPNCQKPILSDASSAVIIPAGELLEHHPLKVQFTFSAPSPFPFDNGKIKFCRDCVLKAIVNQFSCRWCEKGLKLNWEYCCNDHAERDRHQRMIEEQKG